MKKIFYRCKKCLFPSTKPDLHFDDKGVCMACHYVEYHKAIDWKKRENDFYVLLEKIKKTNLITENSYDCVIPVSGGKDSTYQVYLVTQKAGLKPLLVNFEPSSMTRVGQENLDNLVNNFGCDLIQLKKSNTYKKLARLSFDLMGDHEWPNHVGIQCWPVQMANNLNIKLIFHGETRGHIGLGRWETLIDEEAKILKRSDVEQYMGYMGFRISDVIASDKSIKPKDVLPYIYPSKEKLLEKNINVYTLGHYFPWEFYSNMEIIKKNGWKESSEKIEGTYAHHEDIDCGFMPMHQYFKFIKYGYGRATDHASYEVRQGRISKEKAKELIIEHDNKIPKKNFKKLLNFLDINEEHFFKVRNRFANPILFKKKDDKTFEQDENGNFITNKIWFDSFDV
jgi:N-acetyl sugar amidotransferase